MKPFFQQTFPDLQKRLDGHLSWIRSELEDSAPRAAGLKALVLGGGYGRGEGGVFQSAAGEPELFNDLDYFLFADSPGDRKLRRWIERIEREGSRDLGIDVEIKCLRPEDVGDPSVSMMFYDLVLGHRAVWGSGAFLGELAGGADASRLPALEATRLLWNRGSGLYFALCRIRSRREADFVQRNHQKCALALCDALLCARGEYAASVLERLDRVRAGRAGPLAEELLPIYEDAVEYKLRPRFRDQSWEQIRDQNTELCRAWEKVFLAIESERLGRAFPSLKDYAARGRRLFRGVMPFWKGPFFALRDALRYRSFLKPVWDYPRAGLMRALCCLLDENNHPTALGRVGDFLPTGELPALGLDTPAVAQWETSYADWWRRYS